jgi:hypothetical protein
MNRIFVILMALTAYPVFCGWQCGPPLNEDPGFDLWCIDNDGRHVLCAWDLDAGEIKRVSTWHRSDYGVEMQSNPTQISQLVEGNVSCIFFDMLVDKDDGVTVTLEMDFNDDGTIEYSHPLPNNDFRPIEYNITPPTWYASVRFIIRKTGEGRAVLAQIKVHSDAEENCTDHPINLTDRPDGAECEESAQCLSGRCAPVQLWRPDVEGGYVRACSSCVYADDCLGGEVCGLEASPDALLYRGCGPAGRHLLGERCMDHPECQTGICCEGICSECCTDLDCAAGSLCQPRDWETLGEDYEFQILPLQCAPGEGKGESGAVCLKDDDCMSNVCSGDGEFKQCFLDGRKCDIDEECPLWEACLPLGVAGGECQ